MADNLDSVRDQYEALVVQEIQAEQELEELERQIEALQQEAE